MLERTAGCLETGSLRRLLPASRKTVKSRRQLHSAFWNHAAGDLEPPALWAALVQGADSLRQETALEQKNSSSGGLFLEFLYPAGTFNFLRSYSSWVLDRQGRQWGGASLARLGQRLYTSSAASKTSDDDQATLNEEGNEGTTGEQLGGAADYANLGELFLEEGLKRNRHYEEAWRQYMKLDAIEQKPLRTRLILYYATSSRVVDAERTIDLFGVLEHDEMDASTYQSGIQAYLRLRNLQSAFRLNKAAWDSFQIPIGLDDIFTYLINISSWTRACSVWWDLQQWLKQDSARSYDLYTNSRKLPNFEDQAFETVKFVSERIDDSALASDETRPVLIQFAVDIAQKAFLHQKQFDATRFTALLYFIHKWAIVTPAFFESTTRTLLLMGQRHLAIKCYRKLREGNSIRFTHATLHTILKTFCNGHSIRGMQEVLDDFFRWGSGNKPSRAAYKMCLTEFAAQGDADTVHTLFNQFLGHHTRNSALNDPNFIAPILHVHSKRGEIDLVINHFNEISCKYGLEPTVLCWNILIGAYGRVQDIDGAFDCFERLLNSPGLKPNDWTFGTLMGIAAKRGDLERATKIYKYSREFDIKPTAAMVDCLVYCQIQENNFKAAEALCEKASQIGLVGSRTRMWNYLIVGYALRHNLENANRILQRMSSLNIPNDEFTYAALMQALAMARLPEEAFAIMNDVLPEAKMRPSSFHYAILMGAYLRTRNIPMVFHIHQLMVQRNIPKTAGTNAIFLRAAAREDLRLLRQGAESAKFERALEMFLGVTMEPQDMAGPINKGIQQNLPMDIAYSASLHSYIMYVVAQENEFGTVAELFQRYKSALPKNRNYKTPISIISALMSAKWRAKDFKGVQECWDLVLDSAKDALQPLDRHTASAGNVNSRDISPREVLYKHQLALSKCVSLYLQALADQGKIAQMTVTVEKLLKDGFILDNYNWNLYIRLLCQNFAVKLAFILCEKWLMPGFLGWSKVRQLTPLRNRLPSEIRIKRKDPRHLRPLLDLHLALVNSYMRLREHAAESPAYQYLLEDLQKGCPKTVDSILKMRRTGDTHEMNVLRK